MEKDIEIRPKDKLIITPSANFRTVDELLRSERLNNDEKLIALYNWKQGCEHQKESTYEGMQGQEVTPYGEILDAIRKLEDVI